MAGKPSDPNKPKQVRKPQGPRKLFMLYSTVTDEFGQSSLGSDLTFTRNPMDLVLAIQANPSQRFKEVVFKK